jgi:hypothetical protein
MAEDNNIIVIFKSIVYFCHIIIHQGANTLAGGKEVFYYEDLIFYFIQADGIPVLVTQI